MPQFRFCPSRENVNSLTECFTYISLFSTLLIIVGLYIEREIHDYDYYSIIKFYLNHFLALSLWWGQPGRQQGLFLPSWIPSTKRMRCFSLVSSFFGIVIQQSLSLRASSVRLFRCCSILASCMVFVIAGVRSCMVHHKRVVSDIVRVIESKLWFELKSVFCEKLMKEWQGSLTDPMKTENFLFCIFCKLFDGLNSCMC